MKLTLRQQKATSLVRNLNLLQREIGMVTVDALKLKEGATRQEACWLALAEHLAHQASQEVLAGMAALGLYPDVPNSMTDEETCDSLYHAARESARKWRLDTYPAGSQACSSEEQAEDAVLALADEFLGLARQAWYRARAYTSRVQSGRSATRVDVKSDCEPNKGPAGVVGKRCRCQQPRF